MTGYIEEGKPIKCDFLMCAAGMGVAGSGRCFLKGDPENVDCEQFQDEKEFEARMIEKERGE